MLTSALAKWLYQLKTDYEHQCLEAKLRFVTTMRWLEKERATSCTTI